MNEDGINKRWDGKASPVEKFAKAYKLNPQRLAQSVSKKTGIAGQSGSTCHKDSDCEVEEKCGVRRGMIQGVCIPDWVGICESWSSAAILEEVFLG